MTSRTTFRTHPEDLTAQKVNLSVPQRCNFASLNDYNLGTCKLTVNENEMDIGIVGAVALIAIWAVLTFTNHAPGYVHLLLTIGFFLLFWRVIVTSKIGTRKKD